MSPQSEGRPSTDGRSGGRVNLAPGEVDQHDIYDLITPSNPGQSNGYDAEDGQLSRPKFTGPAAGEANDSAHSSPGSGRTSRDRDRGRHGPIADRTRSNGGKSSSGTLRLCRKCDEPLTGQFVRALGGTFHLDCFKCRVSDTYSVETLDANRLCSRTADKS